MTTENKKIARRLIEELMNERNYQAAGGLLDPDFVGHTWPQELHGPQGLQGFLTELHTAFPDFHITIDEQIAEGDRVVTRWTASGRQQAPYMGIPSQGKSGQVSGVYIDRIEDGRVVETWSFWDQLGMLQQLGALPDFAAAGPGA